MCIYMHVAVIEMKVMENIKTLAQLWAVELQAIFLFYTSVFFCCEHT